jgi:hypothetical protein
MGELWIWFKTQIERLLPGDWGVSQFFWAFEEFLRRMHPYIVLLDYVVAIRVLFIALSLWIGIEASLLVLRLLALAARVRP